MLRSPRRHAPDWSGLFGTIGGLLTATALSGCPGTLDPALLGSTSGTGGSGNTSGGGGTGGAETCDVTTIFTSMTSSYSGCATTGCHDTADAPIAAAGLDLTLNANIGSRLVGVASPGDTSASAAPACAGRIYLVPKSNPPMGLLIDKITLPNDSSALCGAAMPYPGLSPLTTAQQTCIEQWAEGLIMAAP